MAAPDWVSYVSALTGVVGGVMGFIAYRRAGAMKVLDMRLELRKAEADLLTSAGSLLDLMSRAHSSRIRINTARGKLTSGETVLFEQQWNKDSEAVTELGEQLPKRDDAHEGETLAQLEHALVKVHRLAGAVGPLVQKYQASMAEDKVHVAELRAKNASLDN